MLLLLRRIRNCSQCFPEGTLTEEASAQAPHTRLPSTDTICKSSKYSNRYREYPSMTARSACGSARSPYVSCIAHPAEIVSTHMITVTKIARDIRLEPHWARLSPTDQVERTRPASGPKGHTHAGLFLQPQRSSFRREGALDLAAAEKMAGPSSPASAG